MKSWISAGLLVALSVCGLGADEGDVMTTAVVNGHSVRLGFDTGAGLSVLLWQKAADKLGVGYTFPEGAVAANPTHVIPGVSAPLDLDLLGNRFSQVQINVVRLPVHLARDFDGLVGWSAVRNNIFRFDFRRGNPEVLKAVPEACAAWAKFPLLAKAPTLAFEIPGRGIMAVDTGAGNGLVVSHREWVALRSRIPGAAKTLDDYFMLGSGTVVREVVRVERYAAGSLVLGPVLVEEASATNASDFGEAYLGTLGLAALRQLELIIDAQGGWVYVRPNGETPVIQPYNRLGAVFVSEGETSALIGQVLPGSPAEKAGLRDRDELLRVDDVDVTKWKEVAGIYPLRHFWEKPAGTVLHLVVLRDGKTVSTQVTLQELLP